MSRSRGVTDRVVVQPAPPEGAGTARQRFGGIDVPAVLVGLLAALALQLLLSAAAGAVAGSTFDLRSKAQELAIGGLVAAVVILLVSYFVGGWTAARVARYDGVRNGACVAVLGIVLSLAVGVLGSIAGDRWNLFDRIGLPSWVGSSVDSLGTEAIVAGVLAFLAIMVGGILGGRVGDRYHRAVDSTLASVRPGGPRSNQRGGLADVG